MPSIALETKWTKVTLRRLTTYPPEINGARRSIESIVKDANLPG